MFKKRRDRPDKNKKNPELTIVFTQNSQCTRRENVTIVIINIAVKSLRRSVHTPIEQLIVEIDAWRAIKIGKTKDLVCN